MRRFAFNLAAPTMYLSKQQGHAVSVKTTNTIAAGLAPPYAGEIRVMPAHGGGWGTPIGLCLVTWEIIINFESKP